MSRQALRKRQTGFTLIELVVVLVLLGILGAAATARFQDLSTEAGTVAVRGVAAELSSASAINYAVSVTPGGTPDVNLNADTTCNASTASTDEVEDLFQAVGPPTGFTLAATAVSCLAAAAGATFTCTVTHTDSGQTADATIICTG